MTTPADPSKAKPAGDDRNLVAVDENYKALTFEDTVTQIWTRNRKLVFALLLFVLVSIVAKGGWDYLERQKELDVENAYAAAKTSEQLKTFAAAHPDHTLAGVAYSQLADEAYAAGKGADAIAAYDKALAVVKDGPLAARLTLGRALAKLLAVKTAEGTADLKQLANDTTQLGAIRAEAAYQLASLAAESGNAADVEKYTDQVMKLDTTGGAWMQRVMMLRMSMPPPVPMAGGGASATPAAPTPTTPAAKKEEPPGGMQIKLPGK